MSVKRTSIKVGNSPYINVMRDSNGYYKHSDPRKRSRNQTKRQSKQQTKKRTEIGKYWQLLQASNKDPNKMEIPLLLSLLTPNSGYKEATVRKYIKEMISDYRGCVYRHGPIVHI